MFVFVFQQFSEQNPESASGIKLTMAQLYLVQGTDPLQTKFPFILHLCVKHRYGSHSALMCLTRSKKTNRKNQPVFNVFTVQVTLQKPVTSSDPLKSSSTKQEW